jgi:hypothetical protein
VLKRIHNGGPASIQVVPTGSQPKMMRLRREMAQNDRTKTGFRVGYSENAGIRLRNVLRNLLRLEHDTKYVVRKGKANPTRQDV